MPLLLYMYIADCANIENIIKLMECVCFESVCGRRCCRINVSAQAASLGSIALSTCWISLFQGLLFTVYLVWPGQWLLLSLLSLLTLFYAINKLFLQTSECVFAVSGVGVYVSKSIGPLTLSSLFIPQTATHSVIIYEAIAKYHIHFRLGLYLHSPHSHSPTTDKDSHSGSSTNNKDILVPLFKHSGGSLSLEELQVAYKHLKETIMERNEHQMDFR